MNSTVKIFGSFAGHAITYMMEQGKKSKSIIFTRFSRYAHILHRDLVKWNPLIITGDTPTEERQQIMDLFNTDNVHRVIIGTEAINMGVNLPGANFLINADLPFSLGKLEQRNGRLRHHMQDRPVFIYNLMAKLAGGKNTIDQFVANKILKKQDISDKLLLSEIKEMLG